MRLPRLTGAARAGASAGFALCALLGSTAPNLAAGVSGLVRAMPGEASSMYARPRTPKVLTNVLYVSDAHHNVVTIYNDSYGKQRYAILGRIALPSRPEGITTDAANNLYVTQRDGVLVYPPSTYVEDYDVRRYRFPRNPTAKLVDRNDPTDVAIGPDGSVYVAEQGGPRSAEGGAVAVFAPNSTTPAYTIPFGKDAFVDGVTLDAANNLYVTWRDADRGAHLNVSPPPASPGKRKRGTDMAAIKGDLFRGVLYNERYGAIVYANYPIPEISTYPQIKTDKPFDKLGSPDYIAFDERQSKVYVPDFAHNQIEIFDFPTGTIHYAFDGLPHGAPAGCALLPAPPL